MSFLDTVIGKVQKLKFQAYTDKDFKTLRNKPFEVQYNPSEFSVSYGTDYEEDKTTEVAKNEVKPKKLKYPEVSFDFVLDGTGVNSSFTDGFKKKDVMALVNEFKELCFIPNPDTHQPNFVKIIYGELLYKAVFKSVDIKFTLFKNDGTPLRAKVNAKFLTIADTDITGVMKSFSSPDVTHKRIVNDHESLIMMSNNIYDRNDLYQEVARFNELNTFRRVITGSELFFPSVEK
jgi:Contractile injection system tube protein